MNKARKTIWALLALAVTVPAMRYAYLAWQTSVDQDAMRAEILRSLRGANSCHGRLKLRDVIPAQYDTVCLQTPYMFRDLFERMSGRRAPGFEQTDEDRVFWWLYGAGDTYLAIEIRRSQLIERSSPAESVCLPVSKTAVSFSCTRGQPYYSFVEE